MILPAVYVCVKRCKQGMEEREMVQEGEGKVWKKEIEKKLRYGRKWKRR